MTRFATAVALGALALALVAPTALSAADIDGSYKLVKRVLPDGTEIPSGNELMGFMTLVDGWRNFNVTWLHGDHRDALSLISKTTLSDTEWCEDIQYWIRHNNGIEGTSFEPPESSKECTSVTMSNGYPKFQLPGEPVVVAFSQDGLVATAEGIFVDYWKKVD